MATQKDQPSITWPELDSLAAGATSFRLVLDKDAARRNCVDPRLWAFDALASLDISNVGLRRLDGQQVLDADDDEAAIEGDTVTPAVSEALLSAELSESRGLPRLKKLRDLLLSDNLLGPVLQPEGVLHGLGALRSLDLQGNGLETLPAALVSLTSLTSLNVGRNRLNELPWLSLSLLPELRSVSAPSNLLKSISADDAVGLPPRLTELTLRSNLLAGDGELAVVAQCSTLAALDVADNRLTTLPSELGVGCAKLSRLAIADNPWDDKKLAKLADGQEDQAPAKPVLELLRKGQSRRQLKSELNSNRKPLPPPPRLFTAHVEKNQAEAAAPQPEPAIVQGKKTGKKGKNNARAAPVSNVSTLEPELPRKVVTVSRDVMGVRPHILVALLHVIVDEKPAVDTANANLPLVFHAESTGGEHQSEQEFMEAFEANLGLLEQGLELPSAASDAASHAAQSATGRLREFVAMQTRIHADKDLGDKRRKGAIGTHNAKEVQWPLRFIAAPHAEVKFAPIAIGWMQEKGVVNALEYARQAASGRIPGANKDAASSLQKPAAMLLQLPLCPHLVDSKDVVLSVHPLSNGWKSRTTADARGSLLLECSSDQSEATCRRMLLQLVRETIGLIEGSNASASDFAPQRESLRQRKVRVLVEPVDILCDWDRKRRAEFPTRDELLSLPALPEYCGSPAQQQERDTDSD